MSKSTSSFMQLSLQGLVMSDEIDDFVDRWHDNPNGQELSAYLGMTEEEYSLWVRSPDELVLIIAARHHRRALPEFLNDNFNVDRLAARANDQNKIKRLRQWLKNREKAE